MNISEKKILVGALAVVGLTLFFKSQAKQGVEEVKEVLSDAGQAVNPVNPDNVFSSSVNAVVSAIAGTETTLGSVLFDALNDEVEI